MPEPQYKTVDKFDRIMGSLVGIPTIAKVKPSTIVAMSPLIGEAQTFIVQTFRNEGRDTIFIQYMDSEGSQRLALPPGVADAIARQRDALGTKVRRALGKQQAAERAARGELPAFMKKKKKD